MLKYRALVLFNLLLFLSFSVFAANRYWVASGPGNWNSAANWSSTSGGAGGFAPPGAADVANFDGNGLGSCTIDGTVNIQGMNIQAGYTGTITQNNNPVTVGSGGWVQDSGIFLGDTRRITIGLTMGLGHVFTIGTGAHFRSTTDTLEFKGSHLTLAGSFAHNFGTFEFLDGGFGTHTVNVTLSGSSAPLTLYNLYMSSCAPCGAQSITYDYNGGTVIILKDLTRDTIHSNNLLNGTFEIRGNYYGRRGVGGTGVFHFNGSGTQHIYGWTNGFGSQLPSVIIEKAPTDSLILSGEVTGPGRMQVRGLLWECRSGVFAGNGVVTYSYNKQFRGICTIPSSIDADFNSGGFDLILTFDAGAVLTLEGNTTFTLTGHDIDFVGPGGIDIQGTVTIQ